jgi:hypothetical protein
MLYANDVLIDFTREEWEIVSRPITNSGGAQGLLRDFHAAQVGERHLLVNYLLLDKAFMYAYKYGSGGFQDRFRVIVKAALRTGGWTPEGMTEPPSRHSGGAFGRARKQKF